MNRSCLASALLLATTLAGCISSSPPAPPVRFFDPTPVDVDTKERPKVAVRVDAPSHLAREFVVRTGPHEVVFDARHSWVGEPRDLVEAAIARVTSRAGGDERTFVRVGIETFELDVQNGPRAHVRLVVHGASTTTIDEQEQATDRSPEALAAAMAKALGRAATGVAAATRGGS